MKSIVPPVILICCTKKSLLVAPVARRVPPFRVRVPRAFTGEDAFV